MSIDYTRRPRPESPPSGSPSTPAPGGIDYTKRRPAPAAPPASAAAPPALTKTPAASPAAGPVSLTKRGESVSLTKGGGAIRVNLNWTQAPPSRGLLRKQEPIDLDLGCLVELADGRKTAVQALGATFGSLESAPWVQLDKDDRSGQASDGENLFISGDHASQIKRLAVFAFIYQGAPNWSTAGGVVTIHQPHGAPITIALDEAAGSARMCAICIIEGGPSGYSVRREVQYVGGHRELDELFGWGMDWVRGRK